VVVIIGCFERTTQQERLRQYKSRHAWWKLYFGPQRPSSFFKFFDDPPAVRRVKQNATKRI
jgi:hypothetical protein